MHAVIAHPSDLLMFSSGIEPPHENKPVQEGTRKSSPSKMKEICFALLSMAWCWIFPLGFLAISVSILLTIPKHTSGSVLLRNSDVLLLSSFDSSQSEVRIALTDGWIPVHFYHGLCSEIGPFPQVKSDSMQLITTKNSQYKLDDRYLMEGSGVYYTITTSDSTATTSDLTKNPCIANVFFFTDQLHYLEFIDSGNVNEPSDCPCLLLTEPLHMNLGLTQTELQSGYHFVGLASHYESTLNYTIASYTLEYSIANLSTTVCNFSISVDCSIPLSHYSSSQEICVLASLQADTFIIISYSAVSHRYMMFCIAGMTMSGFGALSLMLANCYCDCVFFKLMRGRRKQH